MTESASIAALRERITRSLDQGQLTYALDARGNYHFRHGSTLVFIQPLEWHERTLVKIFAPLAVDISRADHELAFYLAEKNHMLLFGKFSLDLPRRSVWLEHTLPGDWLDAEELLMAVEIIAFIADEYDEQIAEAAGGKRAIDLGKS
jgi:hypothetical protein